jgi:hypothetical protein
VKREVRNEKGETRSEKGERKREKGDALSNHAAVCPRNIHLSTGDTDIPDDIQIGIGIHSHASFTFIHIHSHSHHCMAILQSRKIGAISE